MKIFVTLFTLATLLLAHAPSSFADESVGSDIAFGIKSFIGVENQLTVGVQEKKSLDNTVLQIREQAGASIMSAIGPVLRTAAESKGPKNPASLSLKILQAAGELADVAKRLGVGRPGMNITLNFIVYPVAGIKGEEAPPEELDGNESFSKAAISNIENFKRSKFGRVLDGKLPLLPVAAAVSFRLNGLDGEARLQLLSMVNPQEVDGPNPISIPEVKSPSDATMMFLEVAQPLQLKMPVLDIKFGKVGRIKRSNWILRFEVSDKESFCSRNNSAPSLWQMGIPLPLYHVTLDLNKTDKVVDADVRLGLLGICTGAFGIVRSEFMKQANQQAADAAAMVTKLLGATPEEFAEMINRDRKESGLEPAGSDD
jgi:hypothetical protein